MSLYDERLNRIMAAVALEPVDKVPVVIGGSAIFARVAGITVQIQYKKRGLQVSEIFGGCICCSLTVSLKDTIEKLTQEFGIDMILIEPSGVADVGSIIQTLTGLGFSRGQIENVMVLDCLRLRMLSEVIGPLTQATINAADKIVISKADVATPEQVEQAKKFVREYRTDITTEVKKT